MSYILEEWEKNLFLNLLHLSSVSKKLTKHQLKIQKKSISPIKLDFNKKIYPFLDKSLKTFSNHKIVLMTSSWGHEPKTVTILKQKNSLFLIWTAYEFCDYNIMEK